MKVVIELSKEDMESYKNAMRLGLGNSAMRKITNGTPLPEGAEILTAEAYSDLCLRASHERKTGKWISDSAYHITVSLDESGKVSCSCHCSLCGDWLTGSDEYACRGNYCPNCGAKMEGDAK